MPKECLFPQQIGSENCIVDDIWGEWGQQICCTSIAKDVPLLQLLAVVVSHAQKDVTQMVNLETYEGEDPRIVRLVNILRKRGVPIRHIDENYLRDTERSDLASFDIRNLV